MASIALDPRILAAPQGNASRDQIYDFVDRLLSWQSFANERGSSVVISRDAASKLAEDGAYPMPADLKKQMSEVGVIEYDMPTLQKLCDLFLNPKVSFQDYVGVEALLYDSHSFNPELLPYPHLPATTVEAESNAVALAVLNHCGCKNNICGLAVENRFGNGAMDVSAKLHDIEHRRDDLHKLTELPSQIKGKLSVTSTLAEFAACADFGKLLLSAIDDHQLKLCIKLAIFASRASLDAETEWDSFPEINLGKQFRVRAQEVADIKIGFGGNIVESVVALYEAANDRLTHEIRTGPGGGDPQKRCGSYGAWRRDVASSVHLHYWKGPGGVIELAWVAHPHDDFYIPDISSL